MPVDFSADHGDWSLSVVVTDPPWFENCYIVRHKASGQQLVVDPGSNADKIAEALMEGGGKVEAILLTHGHPDHLGAVRALQDRFGVPARAHANEEPLVLRIVDYARARLGLQVEQPHPLAYFTDADTLSLGGQRIRAIATPGHTPGGVCFDFGSFVLTGDTLFNEGVGRTDLPGGDGRLLMGSITRLLEQLPDPAAWLYAGHGPRWTVAEARPWWASMMRHGGF
ncbi:putative polyketide biosynthesis zinc-dependent hydrolase PksB [mine drainage metagenome]|uniref:Putative polyketide biosynthesis zinc-dependent hydrolase PksB n=1 Tax=mine drainage metagenome TaxID=410659 RepID=A0A1J5RGN2_9ZZZZ